MIQRWVPIQRLRSLQSVMGLDKFEWHELFMVLYPVLTSPAVFIAGYGTI
jgi:hypothetical protein